MSLALALSLALTVPTEAPPGLTRSQHQSLVAACNAGAEYGLCETTMAVVLAESSACVDLVGDDGTSFGCGQLQVATAQELQPGVTARQLTRNHAMNLRLTAANLNRCKSRYGTWRRAVVCHNSPRDAATLSDDEIAVHKYLARVRERLAFVRERYGSE